MWDLAYLHHPHFPLHQLGLTVEDAANRDVLDVTNPPPFPIRLIEFVAVNPRTPDGFPNGFPDGFFDLGRLSRDDRKATPPASGSDAAENFRWTINLEDRGDVDLGNVQLKRPPFRLTRALIHNGVFYTTALSPKNLLLVPPDDDPNNLSQGQVQYDTFGKTNAEIAADIFCAPDTGKVIIRIDDVPVLELPHIPDQPWQISLTNLCPREPGTLRKFEKGDFHLFYDVLTVTGQKQVIWGEPVVPLIESGRTDCDSVFMGTTQSLDPLFT